MNKINENTIQNYGWAISSAGEHYGGRVKNNKMKYEKYPLYNSHSEHGFIEPLKSFVPSIGISEIVKIQQNKYVLSSMKDKSLKPICIIAAREGSKGVRNKNIRNLGDIPLIAHSIKTAIETNFFSSVIVSTENIKIAKIAKQYGADVPFLRPKKLATDNASMTDVLLHAIIKLHKLNY